MQSMIVVGPGRAGGSLLLAARDAAIAVIGVLARRPDAIPAGFKPLSWEAELPAADLLVIAVRDGAIAEVTDQLAPKSSAVSAAVHMSGAVHLDALAPLASMGKPVGSFHPLQSLPDAATGAKALLGSWVAVTAGEPLHAQLVDLASRLGMRPFDLADSNRSAYHAAASAASNFVVESLAVAAELADAAGVAFEAMRPLAEQVVRNVFSLGPAAALTGPVARGDWETVSAQLRAAGDVSEELGEQFRLLTQAIIHRRYGLAGDD